jgi:hypothetical protein
MEIREMIEEVRPQQVISISTEHQFIKENRK